MPARLRVGATPERAIAPHSSRAHARLRGRIPGNRGPCSTLRRAVCFVARLIDRLASEFDSEGSPACAVCLAAIPSWPQRITRLGLR